MKYLNADIVTLGYVSVDHFLTVETYPVSGQKRPFREYHVMGGGQAATAAVALSRWGVTTRFVGRVGDDSAGHQSISWLKQDGVICDSVIKTEDAATQTAYIIVPKDTGERTVIWRRQPGLNLTAADLKREWFDGASVLLIDGHELEAAALAAEWVKKSGGTVVLDAEHIGLDRGRMLSNVDIAVGSEDFGHREFGAQNHQDTIRIMRDYGVRIAGVTLGREGALVDWGEGIRRFGALKTTAVDTTGAGDIFHAALAYAAFKNMAPAEMIPFANVCAGLSVRHPGGRSGIPALEDVFKTIKHGFNYQ